MLKIRACGSWHAPLGETPDDLRAQVRAALGQPLRRVNRFIELAVLGAARCRARAMDIPADAAVYLCADTGMLGDTTNIIAGLAEDRPPMPFAFMNVSGAMAGFHVAQQFGLHGPNLTLHRSHAGLETALRLLQLQSAPHRHALLGHVDEGCWPLAEQRQRLRWPEGGLAESSHWLYLDADAPSPVARIESCTQHADLDAVARVVESRDRSTLWLCAIQRSRTTAPVADWQRTLRIEHRFEPLAGDWHVPGLGAMALCAFIERGERGTLLLLNQSDDERWQATLLTTT